MCYDYEFLVLALQWPITTCKPPNNCVKNLPENLSILGLWPSARKPPYPVNCKGDNLKPEMVEPIVNRLENDWPNFKYGESDFSLWEMEWNRHGKCSLDIFHNQISYFQTTLRLNSQADIMKILTKNNIMPNDTTLYNTQQIIDSITNDLGAPQLECSESNPPELMEIRICYARNLSLINCPYKHLNIDCGVQLKWPSNSSDLLVKKNSSDLNSINLYFLIMLFIVFIMLCNE
ncbi:ribonuclease Oy-like [Trifolium pratense]|uniref:ribonuclease Oy-like n=1 Tax=Trifolium pratense TaxID=57577 RepID=UPI001E6960A8|nr:ribonuclease Oy-like [Trifolium pratense]